MKSKDALASTNVFRIRVSQGGLSKGVTLTLCCGEMYDNRSRPENTYTPLPSPPCPCLELAEHLLGSKLPSGLGLGLCCAGAEGRGLLAPPPGTAPHGSVRLRCEARRLQRRPLVFSPLNTSPSANRLQAPVQAKRVRTWAVNRETICERV